MQSSTPFDPSYALAGQVRRAVVNGATYATAVRQVARRNRIGDRTVRKAVTTSCLTDSALRGDF
jgi:hypothetical protein